MESGQFNEKNQCLWFISFVGSLSQQFSFHHGPQTWIIRQFLGIGGQKFLQGPSEFFGCRSTEGSDKYCIIGAGGYINYEAWQKNFSLSFGSNRFKGEGKLWILRPLRETEAVDVDTIEANEADGGTAHLYHEVLSSNISIHESSFCALEVEFHIVQ